MPLTEEAITEAIEQRLGISREAVFIAFPVDTDPEVAAIRLILGALEQLPPDSRGRILDYCVDRESDERAERRGGTPS